jgi:Protein of unknown function (DUF3109)
MLVGIQDKIVSFDLFEKRFVCDLSACKGACCIEGTGGAPISMEEIDILEEELEAIKPFMLPEGIAAVDAHGVFYMEDATEASVTLLENEACAFVVYDEKGIAKCAIDNAYRAGVTDFKKPISCHLYPIRVTKTETMEALNFHEWNVCEPACACGSELNVKVFNFLKEPITRAYGEDFYNEMVEVEKELRAEGHFDK